MLSQYRVSISQFNSSCRQATTAGPGACAHAQQYCLAHSVYQQFIRSKVSLLFRRPGCQYCQRPVSCQCWLTEGHLNVSQQKSRVQ